MTSTTPAPPTAPGEVPPTGEKPPSRFEVLWRRRRNLLLALLLLLIATAVVVGSLAVFSSSSVNPESTASSGTLDIENSKEGAAILTATGMVPGDSQPGTVTIKNAGDVSGRFRVSASTPTDTPGPNGGNLSEVLQLAVQDVGSDGAPGGGDDVAPIYDGPFNAMPSIDLGSWAADEEHTFQFTVTFPDAGQPGSETTDDNAYEGAETKVTYTWDATSE